MGEQFVRSPKASGEDRGSFPEDRSGCVHCDAFAVDSSKLSPANSSYERENGFLRDPGARK